MADIGSIIPDTAKSPVAPDLVHPQQVQNGSAPGQLPTDGRDDQSGTANQKVNAQFGNGQAEKPAKPKAGVVNTILTAPINGPRNGIHWGAGVQLSLLLHWKHCSAPQKGSLLQALCPFMLLLSFHSCADCFYCGTCVCRPTTFSSREGQEQFFSSTGCQAKASQGCQNFWTGTACAMQNAGSVT